MKTERDILREHGDKLFKLAARMVRLEIKYSAGKSPEEALERSAREIEKLITMSAHTTYAPNAATILTNGADPDIFRLISEAEVLGKESERMDTAPDFADRVGSLLDRMETYRQTYRLFQQEHMSRVAYAVLSAAINELVEIRFDAEEMVS